MKKIWRMDMKEKPKKISLQIQVFVFTICSMTVSFAALSIAMRSDIGNSYDLFYLAIMMVLICFMLIAGGIWLVRYNNDQVAVFIKEEGILYLARFIDQMPAIATESSLTMSAFQAGLEWSGMKGTSRKMEDMTDIDEFAKDIGIQLYHLHEIQNIRELRHSYQLQCIASLIKYKKDRRILQKAKRITFQIGKYYKDMDGLLRELERMH